MLTLYLIMAVLTTIYLVWGFRKEGYPLWAGVMFGVLWPVVVFFFIITAIEYSYRKFNDTNHNT